MLKVILSFVFIALLSIPASAHVTTEDQQAALDAAFNAAYSDSYYEASQLVDVSRAEGVCSCSVRGGSRVLFFSCSCQYSVTGLALVSCWIQVSVETDDDSATVTSSCAVLDEEAPEPECA